MFTTIVVAYLSAKHENFNPDLLYLGAVIVDAEAWTSIGTILA